MKEFFAYFFGQGNEVEFTAFSLAHFLPILLAAGVIWLIWRYRDKLAVARCDKSLRYSMCICNKGKHIPFQMSKNMAAFAKRAERKRTKPELLRKFGRRIRICSTHG